MKPMIVSLLTLLWMASAAAQNYQFVSNDGHDSTFVESGSLQIQGSIATCWCLCKSANPDANGVQFVRMKVLVNMKKGIFRTSEESFYSPMLSRVAYYPEGSPWSRIQPGTMASGIRDYVLRFVG